MGTSASVESFTEPEAAANDTNDTGKIVVAPPRAKRRANYRGRKRISQEGAAKFEFDEVVGSSGVIYTNENDEDDEDDDPFLELLRRASKGNKIVVRQEAYMPKDAQFKEQLERDANNHIQDFRQQLANDRSKRIPRKMISAMEAKRAKAVEELNMMYRAQQFPHGQCREVLKPKVTVGAQQPTLSMVAGGTGTNKVRNADGKLVFSLCAATTNGGSAMRREEEEDDEKPRRFSCDVVVGDLDDDLDLSFGDLPPTVGSMTLKPSKDVASEWYAFVETNDYYAYYTIAM